MWPILSYPLKLYDFYRAQCFRNRNIPGWITVVILKKLYILFSHKTSRSQLVKKFCRLCKCGIFLVCLTYSTIIFLLQFFSIRSCPGCTSVQIKKKKRIKSIHIQPRLCTVCNVAPETFAGFFQAFITRASRDHLAKLLIINRRTKGWNWNGTWDTVIEASRWISWTILRENDWARE